MVLKEKLNLLHALMDKNTDAEHFRLLARSTRMFEGHENLLDEYIAEHL